VSTEAPPIIEVAEGVTVVSKEENRWNGFLIELMPFQFHWLMKSGKELEYLDAYTAGVKTLPDILGEIIEATEHMEPKVFGDNQNHSKKA